MQLPRPRRPQPLHTNATAIAFFSLSLICFLTPSHSFQPSLPISLPAQNHSPSNIRAQNDDEEHQGQGPAFSSLSKTQAQHARSSETKRRLSRLREGFATPGISSAIPGANNYPVEPSLTEREYFASIGLNSLSLEAGIAAAACGERYGQVDRLDISNMDELEKEKQIALHTTLGLTHLRSLRLKAAYDSFSYVYALHPEAYLWQFGLLQYYFGEYAEGQKTCELNAMRYEAKFGTMGEVASEERIWRDACLLKGRGKKRKNVESSSDKDEERKEMENIDSEKRKAIRLARQLFSCSVHNNPTGVAMTRAYLQSMCQDDEPTSSLQKKIIDPKMYKLHSYFYLGLHYDALGQVEESKQCMKMALKTCANSIGGNNQDITYLLPVIHMTVRDWYDDDDDFEDIEEENESLNDNQELIDKLMIEEAVELPSKVNDTKGETDKEEDKMTRGIRESIKYMRIVDLRQELKKRKLKLGGSKKVLQDRLVNAISLDMKGS